MYNNRFIRRIFWSSILLACCYTYYTLNNTQWTWYLHNNMDQRLCILPDHEMKDMVDLTRTAHAVLTKFNLTHIPFYGSLFGAYRYKNPLPWDQDVDLLLRREEMDQIDEFAFIKEFERRGIRVIYRPWAGSYKIFKRNSQVDMFLFKNFSGTIRRTGIESYVFFVNHRNFHSFPAKYIEKPLKQIEFCGVMMSAPRDGIDVQQYLYRDDWLVEKRPKGCASSPRKIPETITSTEIR